ncbi:flagellar basal body rod protein FlgB [Novispirillum sp. DQ9]|uniref:flagellar basal body rod protein FlgB n=1 Tax=Novispirillum sp. DQ9 TaxID=3398612 RepID=UPI003C7A6215
MDFDKLSLFRMARMRMDWLKQRQKVLAENISNADTPGYRAKDIRELDFKRMALDAVEKAPGPAVTNPGHVSGGLPDIGPYRQITERRTFETSIDGNPIVLEEQMENMARTRSSYTLTLSLLRKNMQMLNAALGRGGGQG